jgi:hypothetical protein
MKFPEQALTDDISELVFLDQKTEQEKPTLPLKLYTDRQEFENKVQLLLKEYEHNKPVGIFF